MHVQLRCPVCHAILETRKHCALCQNNHRFDRAKQGYLNLLPSNKKRSKNPGDDAMMVQARSRFLSQGYYQPVIQALVATLQSFGNRPHCILDAGCGEGFYTTAIQSQVAGVICGVDIAKPAIVAASKRSKDITWLVASVSDLPLSDAQFDTVISIFSRSDWAEFSRVLKTGGRIIMLTPAQQHLLALRRVIYDKVRPYPEDKRLLNLPENLYLKHSTNIQHLMKLQNSQAIMDLLAMTPHYWHTNSQQKEKLAQMNQLDCELEMRLSVIEKMSNPDSS